MALIGNPIVSTDFPVDYASGNGSTTAFTLSVAPASVNSIDVQISGVSQSPQTYSVSGTTLTFTASPPSGTNNIVVRHLGIAGIPNTPSAGSVVTSSIADANVTQAKLASGVAGTGPAFSAYLTSQQSVSSATWTKVTLDTEVFDTNNNFASSRFTPSVAGYYQVQGCVYHNYSTTGTTTGIRTAVYKNGTRYSYQGTWNNNSGMWGAVMISSLIYMNGTTDYLELYGFNGNNGAVFDGGSTETWFSGTLIRAV